MFDGEGIVGVRGHGPGREQRLVGDEDKYSQSWSYNTQGKPYKLTARLRRVYAELARIDVDAWLREQLAGRQLLAGSRRDTATGVATPQSACA